MKMRNKGKVHPSPSSSSSSPSSSSSSSNSHNTRDALSVLNLLPAAILAIASVLSREDREALAYMITRSLKPTSPPSVLDEKTTKKNNPPKKSSTICTTPTGRAHSHNNNNKTPFFDIECFDCYRIYWHRWDSSPNRELISHAIEAFEEHLNLGEQSKKGKISRKKDKIGRRGLGKKQQLSEPEVAAGSPLEIEEISSSVAPENEVITLLPSTVKAEEDESSSDGVESPETLAVVGGGRTGGVGAGRTADNHKGLTRKVLPDVLGLLNSRLWNLWRPNV